MQKSRFIKDIISIISPIFIVYCIYDLLNYLEIPLDEEHFLHTLVRFDRYSVLKQGFLPLFKFDSVSTHILNYVLYSIYIALSIVAITYTFLFHVLCLQNSYEKKWKNVHTLVLKAFK